MSGAAASPSQRPALAEGLSVLATGLAAASEASAAAEAIARGVTELTAADLGLVLILAKAGTRIRTAAAHGQVPDGIENLDAHLPEGGPIRQALRGAPIAVDDHAALGLEERIEGAPFQGGRLRAAAFAPFRREDRVTGLLVAFRFEPAPFAGVELGLLELLAGQAGIALDNMLRSEELTRARAAVTGAQTRSVKALIEVLEQVEAPGGPAELFGALSATVARLVSARRAAFWTLEADRALAVTPMAYGFASEEMERLGEVSCLPDGDGLIEEVVHRDRVLRLDGQTGDTGGDGEGRRWLQGARNALTVPWRVGESRFGALAVYDSLRPAGFGEEEVWVLQVAARAAGVVWRQRQLTERLVGVEREEAGKLRLYAERMAALEKVKTHILNLASHELRTPMTVIRGYLSMLEDGSLRSLNDLRGLLPILTAKANQMDLLITEMLETARLEEGRLDLALEDRDLRSVAREAIEAIRPRVRPGQSIDLEEDPSPVRVVIDPVRVGTILGNLLDNAVKYSPDDSRIEVGVAARGARAELWVRDPGAGIPAADVGRLFTRFGRIVTPENSHIAGTGLGLYLCRELAVMHGGDIRFEPAPEGGSVFTVSLPLSDAGPRSGSRAAAGEGGRPAYDISTFQVRDLIACCGDLSRIREEATTAEAAAGKIVRHLHQVLTDGQRRPATALVRIFVTASYGELPAALRAEVLRSLAPGDAYAGLRCLALLATAGDRPEWNTRRRSGRHQVVPLPSREAVERSPMVMRLFDDVGIGGAAFAAPDLAAMVELGPRTYDVFHVENALGSPHVPDQAEFVEPFGIRSVVGLGGVLTTGELFALVIFSRALIAAESAVMFRAMSPVLRRALEGAPGRLLFEEEPP